MSSEKPHNPVWSLREALGLTQEGLAATLGMSRASIQTWERLANIDGISDDALKKLQELATLNDLPEIAMEFTKGDFAIRSVITPRETLISSHPAHSRSTEHQKWIDMLDEILQSGNEKAINAVCSNLVVFSDYIQQKKIVRPAPKKSAK